MRLSGFLHRACATVRAVGPVVAAGLAVLHAAATCHAADPEKADNGDAAAAVNSGNSPDDPPREDSFGMHARLLAEDPYPSAKQCGQCHPRHYREWSVSAHAYAQLSPVFNAMQNAVRKLTNGTMGDFCIRCHTPVGMALNEPINMSQLDRHPTSREGVTCIVCHRVNQAWGRGAGRRHIVPGDVTEPVYGPTGAPNLPAILADPDTYGPLTDDPRSGPRRRRVHGQAVRFFQITTSAFCGSCHDVFSPTGFRLEDAFSEYKSSPAARQQGLSCQDCHMSKDPGRPAGYYVEPVARVGNRETPPRKRTNHMIVGPDYSIVHPGLFPHNPLAVREEGAPLGPDQGLATPREWLQFDYAAGWGTEEFERTVSPQTPFPLAWASADRRFRAREILEKQFSLLNEYHRRATRLLAIGYRLGEIERLPAGDGGLAFRLQVSNGTTGHGTPTGFDAERLVFLHVIVRDRFGRVVFQSGDRDPNGDVRDAHSFYVHNGELPEDRQLFSLQTRFLTRNIRGGEREQILPIAVSLDPLPFVRPETRPFTVLGRPIAARKHKHNIEVGGSRWAEYHVPARNLTGATPYTVDVALKAQMVPVNLVHRISFAGFDYGLSAAEVARRIVAGTYVVHTRRAVFD